MSTTSKKKRGSTADCNRPLPGALTAFSISIMEELNTPLSKSVLKYLQDGTYAPVVQMPGLNPPMYSDALSFKKDYLVTEMLSKYPIDIGIDRAAVAMATFLKAEDDCAGTNKRFSIPGVRDWTFWERSLMERARQNIETLLKPFCWDDAARYMSFGPGATSTLSRRNASTENKLQYGITATSDAAFLALVVWDYNGGWKAALDDHHVTRPNVIRGSRIITVPKNAKTDRVIAIEPDLNMYIQKGLGGLIRHRLRAAGLDLDTAFEDNHRLAKVGSMDQSYATIDLKAASDTISKNLVEFLMPADWFSALDSARSKMSVLPCGTWVGLNKFSSMGNGFTFELESLIFWALCTAVMSATKTKGHISVFGDDIIVPTKVFNDVREILSHCGFTVNEKKTFRDGPFRESCGKHYFDGYDVTPFYLKKEESTVLTVIQALNRAKEWSIHPVYGLEGLEVTYKKVQGLLPPQYRKPRIPYGYGDGALWADFDEVCPQKAPRGTEGWVCPVLLPITRKKEGKTRFSVLASLMRLERTVTHKPTRLDSEFTGGWKRGRMLVTRWPQFGNWEVSKMCHSTLEFKSSKEDRIRRAVWELLPYSFKYPGDNGSNELSPLTSLYFGSWH